MISEFLARNTTLLDNLGQKSGWIEIHNPTPNAVALDGWHLTNDAGNKTLWQFPDPTPDADLPLAPGGYLVVWASGADRAIVGQPLHTSFVLSTESGYLALIRPDGATVASAFAPTYARQMADVAYGWTADGRRLGYFTEPSPGMPNGNNANGSPEPVLISEIMYYAAHGQPGSVNYVPENSRQEYVELYNRSTTAVSLKDWQVDNWWFALEPIKPVAGISRSGWTATATLPGHDGAADFTSATMADDGLHGDGLAGDGMYGAALPAQPNNTVVEFYVSAGDAGALLRRWPAAPGLDGQAPAPTYANHTANLLYQVDNSFDPAAGNVATVVLTTLAGAAPHVTLADAGGNTLATGRTGPTNLSETISNFTTTATATFDLTVTADAGTDYSLTVIKNAAFDLEPNNTRAAAQNIAVSGTVLGGLVDAQTARFTVSAAGLADGPHDVTIAAGAIASRRSMLVDVFHATFTLDRVAPRVIESSLVQDQQIALAAGEPLVYTARFDEPLNAASLEIGDVSLVGQSSGSNTAASLAYDPATQTLTLQYNGLAEDVYTLTLRSADGRFEDLAGNDLDGERNAVATVPSGNAYRGGTAVNAGVLQITAAAALSMGEALAIGPGATVVPVAGLVRAGAVGGPVAMLVRAASVAPTELPAPQSPVQVPVDLPGISLLASAPQTRAARETDAALAMLPSAALAPRRVDSESARLPPTVPVATVPQATRAAAHDLVLRTDRGPGVPTDCDWRWAVAEM